MLHVGSKQVGLLYIGSKAVAMLYRGSLKIWEAVSSCFGSGYWRSDKPWKGGDAWKTK